MQNVCGGLGGDFQPKRSAAQRSFGRRRKRLKSRCCTYFSFLCFRFTRGFWLTVRPVSWDAHGAALEPTGAGYLSMFGMTLEFGEMVISEQAGAKGWIHG